MPARKESGGRSRYDVDLFDAVSRPVPVSFDVGDGVEYVLCIDIDVNAPVYDLPETTCLRNS